MVELVEKEESRIKEEKYYLDENQSRALKQNGFAMRSIWELSAHNIFITESSYKSSFIFVKVRNTQKAVLC